MAVFRSGQYTAVGAVSAKFTNPMEPQRKYLFSANVNCWVRITVTGGEAEAGANNLCYTAGNYLPLESPDFDTSDNAYVHVIQDSVGGGASLMLIERE